MIDDLKNIDPRRFQFFQEELAMNNFNDAANVVLDNPSNFNSNDLNYITGHLQKGKKKYLKAGDNKDKKAKQLVMSEIPNAEKQWDQIKEFRKGIAIGAQDKQYGITRDFKISTQGQDIARILTGENTPVINENGTYGFMMTNPSTGNPKWMSLRNILGLVKSESFDKSSKKIIHAMGQNMIEQSKVIGAGEFPYEDIKRKVKTNIIDRGNIRSLTKDKHLEDSFINNMISSVKGMSYRNIGLNKEGNLDDNDAKQVVNTMLLDKEAHLNYLTDYYTNFMAQNWKTDKDKNKNANTKQESTAASLDGQGGGRIIGNKYIPKA